MIRLDRITSSVMPALDAGIHVLVYQGKKVVDCRIKSGNDDWILAQSNQITV
jgi:coenzyme F420-reducing hydrogenase delta subunit